MTAHAESAAERAAAQDIRYVQYAGEHDMKLVKELVDPELSEPYSIFTYRLFLTPWPHLCHFCYVSDKPVGVVVCKIDDHKSGRRRGYIGMIVVLKEYRKYGIGSELARRGIVAMIAEGVEDIVLECEVSNIAALNLYDNLGFVRDKRLNRYYLTGSDAIRLKLRVKPLLSECPSPHDAPEGHDGGSHQKTSAVAAGGAAQSTAPHAAAVSDADAAACEMQGLSVEAAEEAVAAALTVTPLRGVSD